MRVLVAPRLVVAPQEPPARSALTSTSVLVNSVMHPALFYSDLPNLELQSIRANRDVELHLHVKMETLLLLNRNTETFDANWGGRGGRLCS
jgi:hypothetical protein